MGHLRLVMLVAELGILSHYCSREAYAAALTGQPIEGAFAIPVPER